MRQELSNTNTAPSSAWFIGPKSENGAVLAETIRHIVHDYLFWRRNYFPEDGVVVDSSQRRQHEVWNDLFNDRLLELLGLLKSDFPFFSPRYMAHMVAEQTMPSIAGYVAGMLYNPNNVSRESAPVTVQLELEAAGMIAKMVGYDPRRCWAHLTSGGTIANVEALWVARSVRYLPLLMRDVVETLELEHCLLGLGTDELMRFSPSEALPLIDEVFGLANEQLHGGLQAGELVLGAWAESKWNVVEEGVGRVCGSLASDPVILVPETHHYCFPKIADLLGLGRRSLVSIPVDERLRMDCQALSDQLDGVEESGGHVLAVVAVMGSTEEGAIDPLDEILQLRDQRRAAGRAGFWIHADAAWGGYLRTMVVPERLGLGEPSRTVPISGEDVEVPLRLPGREVCDALEAMGGCDSVTVDPHKLGYIPYPVGAVCFRSKEMLPLVRQDAPYLAESPESDGAGEGPETVGMYVLEGSKPGASAASVWLSHSTIPLDNTGHGQLLRDTVRNACELHSLLERWPDLVGDESGILRAVTLCPPDASIVCCAFRAVGMDLRQINKLNGRLYERFSLTPEQRGRIHQQGFFVSRTELSLPRYRVSSLHAFLERLGTTAEQYRRHGVLLLRMTLMSPWISPARERGRDPLAELTSALYLEAQRLVSKEPLPSNTPE